MAISDCFSIPNALFGGIPPEPATVSFQIEWILPRGLSPISNEEQDYSGAFTQSMEPGAATIWWSAVNEGGFSYETDPAETSINHFAILGHERNDGLRYCRWWPGS